ncbi:MAG: NADH-quinone oxidoreductase subunit J [Bacteroidia bacterium]|nr:NADH-quinone oxidoreductase subunit J [Bacteroidia bacterium]
MLSTFLFWFLSIVAIAAAIGTISARNPVFSALSLVLNMFALAGLYLTLQAEFIAVIQVMVYAGAIMVLFLFVIMLLNLGSDTKDAIASKLQMGLSIIAGGGFVLMMTRIFMIELDLTKKQSELMNGKAEKIGEWLLKDYVFPFEMISVILLASLVGAILIAKKSKTKSV